MLIYLDCVDFPCHTFVVRVSPLHTIARIRAQMLHILHEIGREEFMFRLRFNGEFLKDAFFIADYNIVENAVLKMVPVADSNDSYNSSKSVKGVSNYAGMSIMPETCRALEKEVNTFKWRERLILDFKTMLMGHFLLCWLGVFSSFWYACLWMAMLWIGGVMFCPSYTHLGGYIGKMSIYKVQFFVCFGLFALCCAAGSSYLSYREWIFIIDEGCLGFGNGTCSEQVHFSMVYYPIQVIMFLAHSILAWIILHNMKLEVGDYVEKCLVQELDLEKVVKMAKGGNTSEKRWAAVELANMAACNDDNKFSIAANDGLKELISLALFPDDVVRENAVEAIAEMCTIPAIQDAFVNSGDARLLTALLLSDNPRLVHQTASALYTIVCEMDETQLIFGENGIDDLCRAASISVDTSTQGILAAIFTSLACNTELRKDMVCRNSPAQALLKLCESQDTAVCLDALQSLEILAIESSSMICAQDNLLPFLIRLPLEDQYNVELYLVASKILLYFAENYQTCSTLLSHPDLKQSLHTYISTKDATTQRVVIRIIYYCSEDPHFKSKTAGLDKILREILDDTNDPEIKQMAEKALEDYENEGTSLKQLPKLSDLEKLDASMRM